MTIHIQYKNDKYDYVDSHTLDNLIERSEIKQFYRFSEKKWVRVGIDSIRGTGVGGYAGPERRHARRAA